MSSRIYNYDNEELNLDLLQEECAEVIQAISKIKRFGWDNTHPTGGIDNRAKLNQELGHVLAMVDTLMCKQCVMMPEIVSSKKKKLDEMVKYYKFKENTAFAKDQETNR